MAIAINPTEQAANRSAWTQALERLATQLTQWSEATGWQVRREDDERHEELTGPYVAPRLLIIGPKGERLHVAVLGNTEGDSGKVEMYSWPYLRRVVLRRRTGEKDWRVITDSDVPLRMTWEAENFRQLAQDLWASEE